jgi:hypothetical protein
MPTDAHRVGRWHLKHGKSLPRGSSTASSAPARATVRRIQSLVGVRFGHRAVPPQRAPNAIPWTWGPITIPGGQTTYAVGVYDIIYWVDRKPDYQWQYVNGGRVAAPAAGGGHLYCAY